ncbi:hypothetical protein B0J17DRAFT_283318 [Rhizoctonia solani]|nr:hypothetical protein B0J17DRAFT_283318 [Rhizoctonia solani]
MLTQRVSRGGLSNPVSLPGLPCFASLCVLVSFPLPPRLSAWLILSLSLFAVSALYSFSGCGRYPHLSAHGTRLIHIFQLRVDTTSSVATTSLLSITQSRSHTVYNQQSIDPDCVSKVTQ